MVKTYRFHADHAMTVIIADDELMFSPNVGDRTFRKVHWPKADVAAVSIEGVTRTNVGAIIAFGVLAAGAKKNRATVSVTHKDGRIRRYTGVTAPAAEVATQFDLRGYPVTF